MGKKVVLFLLIVTYILSLGCSKKPAAATVSNSDSVKETLTEAIQTVPENVPEGTIGTVPPATEVPTPPEEVLPPEPVSYWHPICNEYISFFETKESKEAFAKIPVGSTIGLLKWDGIYAQVMYEDQIGYVYANCLKPVEKNYFTEQLKVLTPTTKYTYEQMLSDINQLKSLYPQMVSSSVIGQTELKRDIPVMVVGNKNAKYHILIQAAIHGREHFTAWLAMAMVDQLLLQDKIPDDVCYHIIPMANPDGVIISQTGKLGEEQWMVYELDWDYGYTRAGEYQYATQWKANALGVDINRNFISGWDPSDDHPEQSSERYRGSSPFSSMEARALRDYTEHRTFNATISLHAYGSVLYYQYGTKEPVNQLSLSLANAVQGTTGYSPTAFDNTTGAGYKDWVMDELGIPSLTVEIGGSEAPLSEREIYNTFDRCRDMLPAVYRWVTNN